MSQSPYKTLGVSTSASQDEIREAYRKLAKKHHPDLNPGNKEAERKFKDISVAYEQIGTPEARAKFDRGEQQEAFTGRTRAGPYYSQTQRGGGRYSQQFGGFDEDFLNSIFEQMRGGGAGPTAERGQDTLYQMDVDFKDAVLGGEREITFPNGKRLRVKIPAGVESGTKLRFAGQGAPGPAGSPTGDAYVQLNVRPSSAFTRTGNDLEIELPISFAEAILGTEVKAPTIDGSILLKIPPSVSAGQKLRVAGKGVPIAGTSKRGDQIVTLKIVVPKDIDADLRQAVESWSKRHPFNPREKNREGATP